MKQKIEKKILSIGLIAIGITAIIFSYLCFTFSIWNQCFRVYHKTYGGDAYTGIQNAAADTANNVWCLAYDVVQIGEFFARAMGYSLFIVGLCLLLIGITKAIPAFKKQKNNVSDEAEEKVENI